MSLFTITFDESNSSDSSGDIQIWPPPVSNRPRSARPLSPLKPGFTYRNLSSHPSRSVPLQLSSEFVNRIEVRRDTAAKLNGPCVFFKGLDCQKQLFLAKAKFGKLKSIPITRDSEIHLRSESNYVARLVVENDQTDFTLVDSSNRGHVLVVQFAAPRLGGEGARRVHVRFLCNTGLAQTLVSLPLTRFVSEIGFPIRSVKNTVIGDDTGMWQFAVRKSDRDSAEVRARVAVDPLWLFAIGIAVFLGKRPMR
jgi:hypothetical protein